MHEQPVLLPGSPGEWDADGVLFPSVVFGPEGYRMAYEGFNQSAQTNSFGWATSEDGLSWTKYDHPDTTATPYAESDPVLVPDPESDWDSYRVGVPNLVLVPDGYLLAYYGQSRRNGSPAIGLASSPDGVAWERYHANPVFASNDLPGGAHLHLWDFYYDQNTAFLFVEGQSSQSADIWLSVFEGDLP